MVYKKYTKKTYRKPYRVPKVVKNYIARRIDASREDQELPTNMRSVFPSISSIWTERPLFAVSTGTSEDARTGGKLKIKSVEIDGILAAGASETLADDPYNVVRIILGLYRGTVTNPLTTAGATIDSAITPYLNTGGNMIAKYMDRYIPLTITSTEKGDGDGYTPGLYHFKYKKYFKKGIVIDCQGTGASPYNKMLTLSLISDSDVVPNPGFIRGWMRCTFEDI